MVCSFPSRVPHRLKSCRLNFSNSLGFARPGTRLSASYRNLRQWCSQGRRHSTGRSSSRRRRVRRTDSARSIGPYFSEQQSPRRLSEHFAGILYTIPAQIATRHFSESETDRGAEHELHHSKRQNGSLRQKRLRGFQSRSEQCIDRNAQNARQQRVQKLRKKRPETLQSCGGQHGLRLRVNAEAAEGKKKRRLWQTLPPAAWRLPRAPKLRRRAQEAPIQSQAPSRGEPAGAPFAPSPSQRRRRPRTCKPPELFAPIFLTLAVSADEKETDGTFSVSWAVLSCIWPLFRTKMPSKREDATCTRYRRSPARLLPKTDGPTTPKINAGPQLLQKRRSRFAVCLSMLPPP